MHAAAQAAWHPFITRFEGNIPHMYLDDRKQVAVGIGKLIDSIEEALELPFEFQQGNTSEVEPGTPATSGQIEAEWTSLKYHPSRDRLALRGPASCARLTQLDLAASVRQQLFERTSSETEATLVTDLPDFPQWPADAQLALMSMARTLGKSFLKTRPQLRAACNTQDFIEAAHECRIPSWHPERNHASVRLFQNAARVRANPNARNPATLYYPEALLERPRIKSDVTPERVPSRLGQWTRALREYD